METDGMPGQKTVLVTGATGAIGPSLVHRLIEHDYQVHALVRTPPAPGLLWERVKVFQGTINEPDVVRAAMEGVDTVFHLAAKLHINNPRPEVRHEYSSINIDGTRCLVAAAQQNAIRRLIFFSTINVYGPSHSGQELDEETPAQPDSWYAETKAAAEQIVLAGAPSVVMRLAAVYGPRMKGNYPRLLNALAQRRFVMVGDGHNRRTLVHVADVCSAALLVAEHPLAGGKTYNVTDGQVHTLREVIDTICLTLGQRSPRFHLPATPINLAAGLLEDALRTLGKGSPIERATIQKLLEDVAVSGRKIQQQLGFCPRYDLISGWRQTVQSMMPDKEP